MAIHNTPNMPLNESSAFPPGVVYDGTTFHMVWVANNDSRDLLYATSQDGIKWDPGPSIGEKSVAAPALGVFKEKFLIVAFVANNPTRQVLYSTLHTDEGNWSHNYNSNESAKGGVTMAVGKDKVNIYFVANNETNELLGITVSE